MNIDKIRRFEQTSLFNKITIFIDEVLHPLAGGCFTLVFFVSYMVNSENLLFFANDIIGILVLVFSFLGSFLFGKYTIQVLNKWLDH